MGKQSGRMYYQGKDHFDLFFKGSDGTPRNHSKIYLGNKLLWKREKPKFLFIGRNLSTTETFRGISEFASNDYYPGCVSFFCGYYFMSTDKKICISDNGYDWKCIYETEENVAYMERLGVTDTDDVGTLIIITSKKIIYCYREGENGFRFENKYELKHGYKDIERTISSGKLILMLGKNYNSPDIVIGKEEIYETKLNGGSIHAGKESGCFYRYYNNYGIQTSHEIQKSYDLISWNYFCNNPKINIDGTTEERYGTLFEYNGDLCMFRPTSVSNSWIMKVKDAQPHILMPKGKGTVVRINIINDICLLPYTYRDSSGKSIVNACIINDLFSADYDENNFLNTEQVKKTFGFTTESYTWSISDCASKDMPFMFQLIK